MNQSVLSPTLTPLTIELSRKCKGCGSAIASGDIDIRSFSGRCPHCDLSHRFVRIDIIDGARYLSPGSASTTVIAYDDCSACLGTGLGAERYQNFAIVAVQCGLCDDRHRAHPVRRQKRARRVEQLRRAAESVWRSELVRLAENELRSSDNAPSDIARLARELGRGTRTQSLRLEIIGRYDAALERHRLAESALVHAT